MKRHSQDERIPAAILMSGTGSNARKLLEYRPGNGGEPAYQIRVILSDNPGSNYRRIAEDHGVAAELNDIHRIFGGRDGNGIRDPQARERYDRETDAILRRHGIRLLALAGYDWILAPFLCSRYVVLNVHPGDLRVRDANGRRRYIGLGWIPSAKALLAGETHVHSSVHLVTEELDGGPIARVSRGVSVDLPAELRHSGLLPEGMELRDLIRRVQKQDVLPDRAELFVQQARTLQERLKETGDWVEFPVSLDRVADLMRCGRLVQRAEGAGGGRFLLDGREIGDLFLQDSEES